MPSIIKRINPSGTISYQVKVRVKGYPPETATFEEKTAAKHWGQKTEAAIREGKHFPNNNAKKHTVADLIDAYLKNLKGKNSHRHDAVKPLLDWWKKEIGHTVMAHFSSESIIKGQQKLINRKKQRKNADGSFSTLTPSTVNKYVIALHTAVNYGIKPLKWITTNPVNDVEKLKEPAGRTRFLSEEEIVRLLDACKNSKNPYLYALVILGIATGARRSEIRYMRWVDVNADVTLVTLPKTKNGEIRCAHITGVAAEIIKKMRDRKEAGQIYIPLPARPKTTY